VQVIDEEHARRVAEPGVDEPRRGGEGELAQPAGVDVDRRRDVVRGDLERGGEERQVGAIGIERPQRRAELAQPRVRAVGLVDAARRLEQRPERVQAGRLVVPRAAALGARRVGRAGALEHEPRLADAGVPGDEQRRRGRPPLGSCARRPAPVLAGDAPEGGDPLALRVPARERAEVRAGREARAVMLAAHGEDLDRAGDALQLSAAHRLDVEAPADEGLRRVADDDRVGLGECLQPRGLVGGRARDAVAVEDDEVGVHRDPEAQLDLAARARPLGALADRPHHVERAEDRPPRVVLVDVGVAEADEHPVALVVLHEAAEPPDRGRAGPAVVGEDLLDVLGVATVGHRRRADEVAEHQRHLAALGRVRDERLRLGVVRIEREDRVEQRLHHRPVPGVVSGACVAHEIGDPVGERVAAQERVCLLACHWPPGRRRSVTDPVPATSRRQGGCTTIRRFASGRTGSVR
jgi:hypothetical protein